MATLQAKRVEMIKLATLHCAITGRPYHNDIQASFKLVGGNKDEGPWVFEFPSDILRSIASVEEGRVKEVAKAWASTDELKMDRWSVEDASGFIRELSSHAGKAVESERSMYLWLSL